MTYKRVHEVGYTEAKTIIENVGKRFGVDVEEVIWQMGKVITYRGDRIYDVDQDIGDGEYRQNIEIFWGSKAMNPMFKWIFVGKEVDKVVVSTEDMQTFKVRVVDIHKEFKGVF